MKKSFLVTATIICATSLMAADAKDEITSAAKKLADAGGYTWKHAVEVPEGSNTRFRPGPTEGKIAKDGTAHLTITRGDNTLEAVLKGQKGAIKTQDGWQSLAEITESEGQNPIRFIARILQNFKPPAAEAQDLASHTTELKKDGETYAGGLNAEGVKNLLRFRRPGGDAPEVSGAKGSVKFWTKDGQLSKYQFHVEGKMNFNGNDVDIDRTTTVEIKQVGDIKVEVPEEAKKKLS